ncbi:hypothetical protein D3C77_679970 [compost metagenome]
MGIDNMNLINVKPIGSLHRQAAFSTDRLRPHFVVQRARSNFRAYIDSAEIDAESVTLINTRGKALAQALGNGDLPGLL